MTESISGLIKPGSKATLHGSLQVTVIAVLIRSESLLVQYEVAWISSSERQSAWVEAMEIDADDSNELSVGFSVNE